MAKQIRYDQEIKSPLYYHYFYPTNGDALVATRWDSCGKESPSRLEWACVPSPASKYTRWNQGIPNLPPPQAKPSPPELKPEHCLGA